MASSITTAEIHILLLFISDKIRTQKETSTQETFQFENKVKNRTKEPIIYAGGHTM
jgi:hypothetical protein